MRQPADLLKIVLIMHSEETRTILLANRFLNFFFRAIMEESIKYEYSYLVIDD